MPIKNKKHLNVVGPGIVIAATGIGAGDLIAAALSGANFGLALLWAVILGAVIKYVLNEGIARWQLSTGKSLMQGWIDQFPAFVSLYFIVYLVLWSFIVGGALISACGLAAYAVFPQIPLNVWAIIHSLLALALVFAGNYKLIETLMKLFIALMFLVVTFSAVLLKPDVRELIDGAFSFAIPAGSAKFILGVIGGVGGSVTLLSYGYWIREKKWTSEKHIPFSRIDLVVAYTLTGVFGIAIMLITADLEIDSVSGSQMVLNIANRIGESTGLTGKYVFLIGFWGAVFSSMIGVWNGVPYIFADFRSKWKKSSQPVNSKTKDYRLFLVYIALFPLLLLWANKPVWIVLVYSIAGAFFMPFLAGTLFTLNNKKDLLKVNKNSIVTNAALVLCLILFVYLSAIELLTLF